MTRILPANEYDRLAPIIEDMGENGFLPSPTNSFVIVEEDDETGEIIGMTTFQYLIHLEPTWVRKDKRTAGVLLKLIKFAKDHFEHIHYAVMHTSQERVAEAMRRYPGVEEMVGQKTFVWRRSK